LHYGGYLREKGDFDILNIIYICVMSTGTFIAVMCCLLGGGYLLLKKKKKK